MTTPRVLISGAGIGGLSLAQGLKKARVPFHVFEGDLEDEYPRDGYRIRINEDGAAALEEVLTPELWAEFERTCALTEPTMTSVNALDGRAVPIKFAGQLNQEPYAADRTILLRNVLMKGLHGHITFGKECTGYTITSSGVSASFSDGTSMKGILLVGADGPNSRIRNQFLPNHSVYDSESCSIYGKTDITPKLLDWVFPDVVRCMTVSHDKTHDPPLTLITDPTRFKWDKATCELPQDHVYWALVFQKKLITNEDLSHLSHEGAAQLSLRMTASWDRSLRTLLELQDCSQTTAMQILTSQPNIPAWTPSAKVTLLGDAIHIMSPIGGVGASTALRDAANLSTILAGGVSAEGIGRYEEMMREYAGRAIQHSIADARLMFRGKPFDKLKPIGL